MQRDAVAGLGNQDLKENPKLIGMFVERYPQSKYLRYNILEALGNQDLAQYSSALNLLINVFMDTDL